MTPTQQIIPGPRLPEGRNTGRRTAIELSRPMGANRPQPEASVNYSALLRRHRNAIAVIIGGTLLLSVLYTLVAHKVYKSEVILEVTGINQDFMGSKDVDPTSNQVTGDQYIETQTKLLKSPPVMQRTAAIMGPKVPGAIAASQGLIGTVRGWFGEPSCSHPGRGRGRGVEYACRRQGQGRWNFGSDHVDGSRSRATADRGHREHVDGTVC